MYDLLAPFVVGLLGSVHCLGMCGPLVVAYALHSRRENDEDRVGWKTVCNTSLVHHAAFHLGRIFTYGVFGAAAAGLFQAADVGLFFSETHGLMKLVGGMLLVLFGLVLLRAVPLPKWLTSVSMAPGTFLGRCLPPLLHSPRVTPKLTLGLVTGLLPCGLSWAMIINAAATQDPLEGWVTMLMFGLGTMPLLLLTGLSVRLLSLRVRFMGERMAACSVILMGGVLLYRGTLGACCT